MSRKQKFLIGMMVLVSALVMTFWAFSKPCLEKHQLWLLYAYIPLASGFIAWSFYGALELHRSPVLGVVLSGTGGFAVFVVMLVVLRFEFESTCAPSERDRLLGQLALVNRTISDYNNAKGNEHALGRVQHQSRAAIVQLDGIDGKKLGDAENVARYQAYAFYTVLIAAIDGQLSPSAQDAPGRKLHIQRTIESVGKAQQVAGEKLKCPAGDVADASEACKWLTRQRIFDRLHFILTMAYALRSDFPQSDRLALDHFGRISSEFLRDEGNPGNEPALRSLCARALAQDSRGYCKKYVLS